MQKNCNIVLVSLIDDELKKVGLSLADKLNFFYLNCEEMIDYSLFDKEKMLDVCGTKYVDKQTEGVVRSLNSYENTVITMNYSTFSNNISNLLSNNKIIYLKITQLQLSKAIEKVKEKLEKKLSEMQVQLLDKLELSDLVFTERDKFLKMNSNISVAYNLNSVEKTVENIFKSIFNGVQS